MGDSIKKSILRKSVHQKKTMIQLICIGFMFSITVFFVFCYSIDLSRAFEDDKEKFMYSETNELEEIFILGSPLEQSKINLFLQSDSNSNSNLFYESYEFFEVENVTINNLNFSTCTFFFINNRTSQLFSEQLSLNNSNILQSFLDLNSFFNISTNIASSNIIISNQDQIVSFSEQIRYESTLNLTNVFQNIDINQLDLTIPSLITMNQTLKNELESQLTSVKIHYLYAFYVNHPDQIGNLINFQINLKSLIKSLNIDRISYSTFLNFLNQYENELIQFVQKIGICLVLISFLFIQNYQNFLQFIQKRTNSNHEKFEIMGDQNFEDRINHLTLIYFFVGKNLGMYSSFVILCFISILINVFLVAEVLFFLQFTLIFFIGLIIIDIFLYFRVFTQLFTSEKKSVQFSPNVKILIQVILGCVLYYMYTCSQENRGLFYFLSISLIINSVLYTLFTPFWSKLFLRLIKCRIKNLEFFPHLKQMVLSVPNPFKRKSIKLIALILLLNFCVGIRVENTILNSHYKTFIDLGVRVTFSSDVNESQFIRDLIHQNITEFYSFQESSVLINNAIRNVAIMDFQEYNKHSNGDIIDENLSLIVNENLLHEPIGVINVTNQISLQCTRSYQWKTNILPGVFSDYTSITAPIFIVFNQKKFDLAKFKCNNVTYIIQNTTQSMDLKMLLLEYSTNILRIQDRESDQGSLLFPKYHFNGDLLSSIFIVVLFNYLTIGYLDYEKLKEILSPVAKKLCNFGTDISIHSIQKGQIFFFYTFYLVLSIAFFFFINSWLLF